MMEFFVFHFLIGALLQLLFPSDHFSHVEETGLYKGLHQQKSANISKWRDVGTFPLV